MHVSLEGNWVNHLYYVCAKYGEDMWNQLNARVIDLTTNGPHPLCALSHGIIRTYQDKKFNRPVLRVATYTAEQFEIFLMISPFALKTLISSEDFASWMLHLTADDYLVNHPFQVRKTERLAHMIASWKEVRANFIIILLFY
jgi:hypothetical protein